MTMMIGHGGVSRPKREQGDQPRFTRGVQLLDGVGDEESVGWIGIHGSVDFLVARGFDFGSGAGIEVGSDEGRQVSASGVAENVLLRLHTTGRVDAHARFSMPT